MRKFRDLPAYRFMRRTVSFGRCSHALAAYLQSLRLARGDRVAVMLPNLPQYPVAVEFRSALPKSPVGKVLRRELRDRP